MNRKKKENREKAYGKGNLASDRSINAFFPVKENKEKQEFFKNIKQIQMKNMWIYEYTPCKYCSLAIEQKDSYFCKDLKKAISKFSDKEPCCSLKKEIRKIKYVYKDLIYLHFESIPCKLCVFSEGYNEKTHEYSCAGFKVKKQYKHSEPCCKDGRLIK